MFTGIITDLGHVRALAPGAMTRLEVATAYDADGIALGASICCNGICLSVIDKAPGWFAVEASAETLAVTTLGKWKLGTPVNLERALKAGDELGGHIVSGHVDGVGRVVDRRQDGGSIRYVVEAPAALAKFIAPKGSIALDGVSLTINEVEGARFGVNIIPVTQRETNLGATHIDDAVNLEIDPVARYVARLLQVNGS
ncbi:MAG TPA: riboflavin synthase [Verrucomicrobiae bacterium]|nr:riboflavin synthase [Verrucomicrobiae bacterium]